MNSYIWLTSVEFSSILSSFSSIFIVGFRKYTIGRAHNDVIDENHAGKV